MRYEASLLEIYLHNILNGFSPFIHDKKLYLAKHLNSTNIFEANAYIISRKEELLEAGCISEYDILKDCIERGVWSRDNDVKMSQLEKVIKTKSDTKEKLLLPSQVKQVEAEVMVFQRELNEIRGLKQSLVLHSIEYKTLLEKRDYLAYLGLYTPQKTHLWNSHELYLENEGSLVEQLSQKYYSTMSEINPSVIRAVARDTDARFRLKMCPMPDFKDLTILLSELRQWCDFYSSIYELSDKPSDDVIQDDDKLDGWLISRRFRNQEQKSVNSNGGTGFTGIVGNREDVEILGGLSSTNVLSAAK